MHPESAENLNLGIGGSNTLKYFIAVSLLFPLLQTLFKFATISLMA